MCECYFTLTSLTEIIATIYGLYHGVAPVAFSGDSCRDCVIATVYDKVNDLVVVGLHCAKVTAVPPSHTPVWIHDFLDRYLCSDTLGADRGPHTGCDPGLHALLDLLPYLFRL